MKRGNNWRGLGPAMSLGIQMVVVTMVITAIGWWLDRRTGRAPMFLIVFFVLGALGGLAVVWRALHGNGPRSGR